MDRPINRTNEQNAEYGEIYGCKCRFYEEYMSRYKDPDEAEERLAIEKCEMCEKNMG